MIVTLQILFSGLIAYSPAPDQKSLTVLVLNDASSAHMPHEAFLSVRAGALKFNDPDFKPDPTYTLDPRERFSLRKGYILSIAPTATDTFDYKPCRDLLPRGGAISKVNACPLEAPNLLATGHAASTNVLSGTNSSLASTLALRVGLNTGTFRPFEDSSQDFLNARKVAWKSPLGVSHEQYVPEVLEWVSPALTGDTVTLTLEPFDGSGTKTVVLKSNGSPSIEVLIYNEPTAVAFCDIAHESSWHSVNHLGRFARLAGLPEQETQAPALSDSADQNEITKYCEAVNNSGEAGKKPAICYGLLMGR